MEFKDLQVFQMVAETGNITRAAKELNYVQSNVTSRIQKLETELNTPLFNRHNRGMILTPEGKKLLHYSEKILLLMSETKKVVQSSGTPCGKLEIGSVETVIKLPVILSAYNKKYENVDLSLESGVTEKLQEKVLNYQLDGAFVTEAGQHPSLVHHDVFQEELVLISDRTLTSLEQLKNKPFLVFSEGCGYRAKLNEWLKDERITPMKMMEFGTFETILGSVIAGLGITFVPKLSVAHLEERGLIHCHSIPDKYSKINTIFIRRKDTYLTPTVKAFIETIELCKDETVYPLSIIKY
ncbi:LysR family transcriptional regulator [Metabacillus fastidiosus]|uniref:LysR family transcriptional regulator n=1 Tax=Metabacillus fastidiosus TaxID=1458 RepID=UPI002E2307C6|nr:LysR family transcriptional regulator [Metabacillus fastidiosus]